MSAVPMLLRSILCVLPLLLVGCATSPPARPAPNPDALWGIVQRDCMEATPRASCLAVAASPQRRDVLLKDAHGDYQFLLLPMDRVSGIESPALLRSGAPNYFAAAWQARTHTEQALGRPLPREVASLALNSPHGRSQHQLHIHVDCLRADVLAALQGWRAAIGTRWQPLPGPLRGHVYQARRLPGDLLTANPVRLLADDLAAPGELGQWSLLVAGERAPDGTPGFVMLATQLDPASGNQASAEELQDHACAVLTGADGALERVR
ncbi:CDP-diacylglycerol diphosphatase [Stenotrophomonas sp. GZD-301]|uniref:CDP-diacylglycerol diphosphatase n=1 Tax=Stenotrophomonas sp. GZD-301 TaxID=3404814 RepID=UPI003BB7AA9C